MSTTPTILPPTLDAYLALITSEHNQKPKFMATVAAEIQPFVDIQATLYSMIGIFTPNSVGDQLDKVGVWVGANRSVANPSVSGLTVLSDDSFQTLIKLTIAMNGWDGTVPGAYSIFNSVFASDGLSLLIQDNQDMTMFVVIVGTLNVVAQAL